MLYLATGIQRDKLEASRANEIVIIDECYVHTYIPVFDNSTNTPISIPSDKRERASGRVVSDCTRTDSCYANYRL